MQRLKKRKDYVKVARGARTPRCGFLLQSIRRAEGPADVVEADARFGFTVTKKMGNAVVRNRIRRRLKEAVRLAGAATVYPYGLVTRYGTPLVPGTWVLHEGLLGVFGSEGLTEATYKSLKDSEGVKPAPVTEGWLGITDKYWATALIPESTPMKSSLASSSSTG